MNRRSIPRAAALLLVLQAAISSADDKRPMVSWDALGQVTGAVQKGRFVPQLPRMP